MNPLVSTDWLAAHLDDAGAVVADVRWRPDSPDGGREAFERGHVPGAVFLDLDRDLADVPEDPRDGGRHPLPDPERFCARLAEVEIGRDSTVICCDDMGGAIASRLWWMLRWVGHERAAVLDGGFAKWEAEGREIETGISSRSGENRRGRTPPEKKSHYGDTVARRGPKDRAAQAEATRDSDGSDSGSGDEQGVIPIEPRPDWSMVAEMEDVERAIEADKLVLDARSAERYRGENETLDPVGGHIEGATSAPFAENLDPKTGTFRDVGELRERFAGLGVQPESSVISHCGSGVTACCNILAMELAGLGMGRLYVGSWSEWIRKKSNKSE